MQDDHPIKAPLLDHICDLEIELSPILELGQGRAGKRRIIPIIGGTCTGKINGKILHLGADWQTIYENGTAELIARYAIETDDGALIEIQNEGFRHGPAEVIAKLAQGEDVPPEDYYMRTTARLETGDARYDWVNSLVYVGTGARLAKAVHLRVFAVT
ncbi:MAG: DUF3237 domain-containing protein [Maritimibacter sp.]